MKGYTQHSIQTRTAEVWVWFVNICEEAEIEAPSLIPEWICSAWYGYNIRGYETGIKELWGIHSTCNGTSWACRFMYSGVALYHTSLSSVVSMYGRYFIIRLKSLYIFTRVWWVTENLLLIMKFLCIMLWCWMELA